MRLKDETVLNKEVDCRKLSMLGPGDYRHVCMSYKQKDLTQIQRKVIHFRHFV